MPFHTAAKEACMAKDNDLLTIGKFNVRIVQVGENYGLHGCLVNKDAPFVEFYDSRYMHTQYGQFITRYLVSTLAKHEGGLCLDGGNRDEWSVPAKDMARVLAFIN